MPKIERKQFYTILIGIFMVCLMVLSMFYYGLSERTKKVSYHGYKFVKTEYGWQAYINGQWHVFTYLPQELENLTMPEFNFDIQKIYILYDPEQHNLLWQNLQKFSLLFRNFGFMVTIACTKEENCPADLPIKDCSVEKAIKLSYANETKSFIDENCLVLQGDMVQQEKYLYKIYYRLLGVL